MILALRGVNLSCFIVYSLLASPIKDPILLIFWVISLASTGFLAAFLNRTHVGWIAAAALFPFWGAAFLAFAGKRPDSALTSVDNSWLNMERPTNKMVVSGIMFFDQPLDKAALEETLTHGLLKFDRFKQRVVEINRFNCWQDDPHFSLDNHLEFHKPPKGANLEDFHQRINHLTEQPLDMDKPLWHMDVFEGVDGGCALYIRIHHCIADGIALIRVLLSMTQPVAPVAESPAVNTPAKSDSAFTHVLHTLVGLLAAIPHALKLPDSPSRLKRPLTGERKTAWSKPLELEKIHHIGKSHNAKINDVVLAATAGALRHYLLDYGSNPDDMTLRVLVPINLKPLDGEIQLGNQVGFVYLALPINQDSAEKRLASVKTTMDSVKGGQEAMLSLLFLKLIGSLPSQLQNLIIDAFNKNASSTMTNVPGPRAPLLFAQQEIKNMMFFGPQSGTMGVGISVLSYAGQMTMGVNSDANLVPDPEKLVQYFLNEIESWADSAPKK